MRPLIACLLASAALVSAQPFPEDWATLRAQFLNPPASFRTAPFFVWNGEVTEADIDFFLEGYKAQGIGAVFVHPRPGLITEYLSERWFQLVRHTVESARRLGLLVWLYDENSYPSGFAGGHVPAQMPESWEQGHGLRLKKLSSLDPQASRQCSVLLEKSAQGFREVAPAARSGPGDYYCFERVWYPKSSWFGGFSYVDLLKPGVTEKFIELTMRGYERTIGHEFGKTVPGIFTDEPHINPPVRDSVRWTPDLFDQFQKRWGYDLKTSLPSLFEETGDWRKVRHNYYALLLDLFIRRWSQPWFKYAEAKKLHWTGHYWEHEWPNPGHGPDHMAMYAWHQVPGIDMLFNQFREDVNAQFGNVRSVKELASVANQLGRRRTLSETYGGSGWELRFEDMKRLGDWEYALGVNLMNQHLSFQTIVGARKYDYPPSFSYHEPWWNHYRLMGDYFGRLSLALASGEQLNRILVLEPTTSAWMYAGSQPSQRMKELGQAFQDFVTRLEKMQVEYDLGSENIIRDCGRVEKNRFIVGRRAYELVVLAPGTENLEASTVKLLEGYLKAGGQVLSFVDPPARVDGAATDRVSRLAAQFAKSWRRATGLEDANVRGLLIPADFGPVEGELFHHRRQLRDGQVLFLANASLERLARAELRLQARGLSRLDLTSGRIDPYPARREAGRLVANVELPPAGSVLLFAGAGGSAAPVRTPSEQTVTPAGPLVVRRLEPNVLRLDFCNLKLAGRDFSDLYCYRAAEMIFKHYGFDTNPWDHSIQYKTAILDRNKFAPDSGFEASFQLEIDAGISLEGIQAVIERPQLWKVAVNGRAVSARPDAWWLDRSFGVYDIGPLLRNGSNTLTLTARPMTVHHELEPICIRGEFGVSPQARGFRVVAPTPLGLGPWKNQNLPFYSGWISYTRSYRIQPAAGALYRLRLGRWSGTVAEVRVNSQTVGLIAWPPYELDLGQALKPGDNQIEVRVCGSLKNLLGPHHGKITRGLASPASFRVGPQKMPPGADYDQLDYGLLEEFQLIEVRP